MADPQKSLAKLDIKDLLKFRPQLTPKSQRIAGYSALLLIVAVSLIWVILPTNNAVVKLNKEKKNQELQIQTLKVQEATLEMESERLDKLREQLNVLVGVQTRGTFNLEDYTTLSIMRSIVQMATLSGCTVEDFRPTQAGAAPSVQAPPPPSSSVNLKKTYVKLSFRGTYPNIKRFVRRLVDYPALVSIEEAGLEREVSQGIEYVSGDFLIVIYGINY